MYNESKGGEIMTDFEIVYLIVLIPSLVLQSILLGYTIKNKKR